MQPANVHGPLRHRTCQQPSQQECGLVLTTGLKLTSLPALKVLLHLRLQRGRCGRYHLGLLAAAQADLHAIEASSLLPIRLVCWYAPYTTLPPVRTAGKQYLASAESISKPAYAIGLADDMRSNTHRMARMYPPDAPFRC